jgi:hypothetical protein
VDVVERRFVLRRHKRQKYRCGCGGCVDTALGPPKLQAGGRYSVGFAVEVAVAKYQVPHAAGAAGQDHGARGAGGGQPDALGPGAAVTKST